MTNYRDKYDKEQLQLRIMIKERINENVNLIDSAVKGYFALQDDDMKSLTDAQIYSISSGGKRIRPMLTLEVCRLFGGRDEAALQLGSAIEMVHTYSLIHDDLPCMDDDDFRRGNPTCHKVFGESGAVLAGDALLTYAFEVISEGDIISDTDKIRAVRALAEAAGTFGMVGGQVMDLRGDTERLSLEKLTKMVSLKTGKLIEASAKLGCIAAGVNEGDERMTNICAYARNIGLAFQITDDILDFENRTDPETKTTFMTYYSVEEAKETVKALTKSAIEHIASYKGSEILTELAEYLSKRLY